VLIHRIFLNSQQLLGVRSMVLLSRGRLETIRDECYADDIEIEDRMYEWSEDAVRCFFMAGGLISPPEAESRNVELESSDTPLIPSVVKLFADSHANTFISIEASEHAPQIIAYPYTAGSAMGLRHADSITGYRGAIESDLLNTRPDELLVFKFGQVDCDFVYYLKWIKDPTLVFETFAADAVHKYFTFVDDLLTQQTASKRQLCIVRFGPATSPWCLTISRHMQA
jgi:hypothetical protein